jgi:hypothetical protein
MRGLARRAPVEEDVALSVLNSVGIHRPHPGVVELKPGVTRAILCERHVVPTCQGGCAINVNAREVNVTIRSCEPSFITATYLLLHRSG